MSAKARAMRSRPTDAERTLWRVLRLRQMGGAKFRRQAPIGSYVADFASFEKKLIIEVDGNQHLRRRAADDRRTAWLEGQGFRVIRFWDHEVLNDLESVRETIWHAVPPHLSPPPQGGRRNS